MMRKEKWVQGLLINLLAIPAILAAGPKGETSQTEDLTGTASSRNSQIETTGAPEKGNTEASSSESGGEASLTSFTHSQLKDIKVILAKTLKDNPEMIIEALQNFTERQQQDQQQKMQGALTKNKDRIVDPASATILGKPDAETKLVVFLDPNCPHCRTFEEALYKVRGNHPNVTVLLKYWPILGEDSKEVARGLLALKESGKTEELSKVIMATKGPFTYEMLHKWVGDQKLDAAKFEATAKSTATTDSLDKTDALAKELGLQGTPTSLLVSKEGVRLVMPTDEKSLETVLKGSVKAS